MSDPDYAMNHFNNSLSEGYIDFNNHEKKELFNVEIKPKGAYKGIRFKKLELTGKPGNSRIKIYNNEKELISEFLLSQMPEKIFVPGNNARLELSLKKASKNLAFEMVYDVETIDSAIIYCKDIQYYELAEGTVSDGSMQNNYSNLNSCKWIIRVPKGKHIEINFDEMHTQANIDYVYLFDGEQTIPEYMMAKFSGQNKPPNITSRTNTVLVWFVTDEKITGEGWQFKYKVVD